MNLNQAPLATVFDASQVRLTELAAAYDLAVRDGDFARAKQVLASALDLALGNEQLARSASASPADALTITSYLQETYSLLPVANDPFLRPLLSVIPTTGAVVRLRALYINGRIQLINGKALYAGAVLSPS